MVRSSGYQIIWVVESHLKLNISAWRYYLQDYFDSQLFNLLEFGFPLDFDRSNEINHTSALQFPNYIQNYLYKEISFGAIYGPFDSKPFSMHMLNFMTREKVGATKRRVIVDLSYPQHLFVNAGVSKKIST